MKRILLAVLTVLVWVVCLASPFGIRNAMEQVTNVETEAQAYHEAKSAIDKAQAEVNSAQQVFDADRSFEVHYGDIDKIIAVLDAVSGVTVSTTTCVDALNYFAPTVTYRTGDSDAVLPSAIRIVLYAEDTANALDVISRMQLPVYEIYVSEPGTLNVIFLTGGGLV